MSKRLKIKNVKYLLVFYHFTLLRYVFYIYKNKQKYLPIKSNIWYILKILISNYSDIIKYFSFLQY